jgi:hypothetical protein
MSHFSKITTELTDLLLLRVVLTTLNINWNDTRKELRGHGNESYKVDMVIKQPTSTDIGFVLENGHIVLIADENCWKQRWALPLFLTRVNQNYTIHGLGKDLESQGFSVKINSQPDLGFVCLGATRWGNLTPQSKK